MLSTPGIGSGLDISSIIDQLMAIERQPLVTLGTDQIELEAKVSAFGKLKSDISLFRSAVSSLSDPTQFKFFKATSSDDTVLSVSANSEAAKGTFNVTVDRIAENHRLAATSVFADSDTTKIGTAGDTMSIVVGGTTFVVDIGDKTLDEIRTAINSASDNAGVTASILQDDNGYHLTLSADSTGSTSEVTATYSAADPFNLQTLNADRDTSGGFTAADLDAVINIENTFTATRSSNTISDVIQGVTMSLEKAGTITLDVSRDDAKIEGSVQQLIGVYNSVIDTLNELRGSVLASDRSSLLGIESQFRNVLNAEAETSSTFSFLFEIGVSTGLDGKLSLDSSVFKSALENDPDGIPDLFSHSTNGIATRFEELASALIDAGGLLDGREQSLNSRIRDLEGRRTNLEFRLVQKEAALVDRFSALDSLVAQLTTTSSFLSTQLTQIAAVTNSSNSQ